MLLQWLASYWAEVPIDDSDDRSRMQVPLVCTEHCVASASGSRFASAVARSDNSRKTNA